MVLHYLYSSYILLCSKVEWFERGGGEKQREAMWIPPIFVSAGSTCSSRIAIASAMALLILLLKHPWVFKSKTYCKQQQEIQGSFGIPPSLGQFSVPLTREASSPSFLCYLVCTSGFWSSGSTVSQIWHQHFTVRVHRQLQHEACMIFSMLSYFSWERQEQWVWALYVEPGLFS